ncbi:MAG: DUF975 family protein [Clostridia bacterium]|nr:DUF975 family protein [Clostridia bacterium]
MMMGSFLFKQKAREALKGNWQNALLITFFCGVFATIAQVLQTISLKDVQSAVDSLTYFMGTIGAQLTTEQSMQLLDLYNRVFAEIEKIPQSTWSLLLGVNLAALVLTPALTIGCNRYFIGLVTGKDIGLREGITGRLNILLKAMWLYVRMFVQIFLWSLLFFIPGVIAALRYSMAAYFMAEDPSISAGEALRRSNQAMKGHKASYFMLLISFIGWNLLITMAQLLISGMLGAVITMVAAQFMSLALNVYINASSAAFYRAISAADGLNDLFATMRRRMHEAGISEEDISAAGFGETEEIPEEDKNADGGEEE